MAHTPLRPDFTRDMMNDACFTGAQKGILAKLFKKSSVGITQKLDQSITASTTLADTELVLPVKKGRIYRVHAVLHTNGTAATPGGKFCLTHTGQTSATLKGAVLYSAATSTRTEAAATATATGSATAWIKVEITAEFRPDGNGTIKVQGAQFASDAGTTVIQAGSYLTVTEA